MTNRGTDNLLIKVLVFENAPFRSKKKYFLLTKVFFYIKYDFYTSLSGLNLLINMEV